MSSARKSKSAQNVLISIRELLMAGEPEQALKVIRQTIAKTPEINNAHGVCLMRLGRVEAAIDLLRELVFKNHVCIPTDTPPLFVANYATALLLKNYNQMAIDIIKGLPASTHPYIDRLKQAVHQWQQSLPLHQWFRCLVKLYPPTPVLLNFAPGQV